MTTFIKPLLDTCGIGLIRHYLKLPLPLIVAYPALMAYFYSMCIFPWLENGQSWQRLQKEWLEWQTLNAGMIALAASVIFYHAATHRENQQAKAKLRSAKASLVATLSDCTKDTSHAAKFLMTMLTALGKPESDREKIIIDRKLFEFYFSQAIERCIELESPEAGEFIAKIPHLIQIFTARLNGEIASHNGESNVHADRKTLYKLIFDLAELQAMINRAFDYARDKKLDTNYLSEVEIFNALSCHEFVIENHPSLGECLTLHHTQGCRGYFLNRMNKLTPTST